MRFLMTVAGLGLLASVASAEVVASADNGFSVSNTARISAEPTRVYQVAVDLISRWWDPAHTFSRSAANLILDGRPGGCLCERYLNGGASHLTGVYVAPSKEIRFSGALGPLQQMAVSGTMIWKLSDATGGSEFEWTYTVGGYRPGGLGGLAAAVDEVLGGQLQRLKRFVETGRPD
jgi:hypothetical protein